MSEEKMKRYIARRSNHGYAIAIDCVYEDGDQWTVLHLVEGAERNEKEVDRIVQLLNEGECSARPKN